MKRETKLSLLTMVLALTVLITDLYAQETATEDPAQIAKLDKVFRRVAKESIPKTVLVKAIVSDISNRAGYGTGAIISDDGYILTCSHVIDIGTTIEVVLADKTVYSAKLLGKNREQDYALLKIEPKRKLPHFAIGQSSAVKAGQWVVALGHPGGPYADKQPAFSAGRVTRLHCKLPVQMMERYYNDAIQTDCPIYAGNSGGPLVNLRGQLIGLNGAILQINDNAYAVPIEQVMKDYDELKAGTLIAGEKPGPEAFAEMQKMLGPEEFERMQKQLLGNLGKLFGGKDNPLGEMFGKDGPFSELFGKDNPMMDLFKKEGPLKDLFGEDNGSGLDFAKLIEQFLKLFNGESPDAPDLSESFKDLFDMFNGGSPQPPTPKRRPIPVRPKKPQTAKNTGYLGIAPASDTDDQGLGGVLVSQVVEGAPADKGDIRKGDVIVAVNGRPTPYLRSLVTTLKKYEVGETVKITVVRNRLLDTQWVKTKLTLSVTLGQKN